jgi:hypothetical protein
MSEELYGLSFSVNQEYRGRDQFGTIRIGVAGSGLMLTKDCAEKLFAKFKSQKQRGEFENDIA